MSILKEKEAYYHKIILDIIKLSKEFKASLQSEFPNSYADIESASTNPNCSCVKRVETELINNREKSLNLLNNFLSNQENFKKVQNILNTDYEALMPKSYFGRVFIIENTEEKFKEFTERVEKDRAMFRSLSTSIGPDGKLYIYFF